VVTQHRGGNYDPLLHPSAAHRDERRRAWKLQTFLNIHHAQAEDYLVPHEAGELVPDDVTLTVFWRFKG
jgi:hypothetical protein